MQCKSSRDERGSALLIVFVFAAIVAIMLYKIIPDAVFEAQRQKEQVLIDRGNEYKTAIKRFLRRNQRYPTSLDQLDNFNNQRYIRRRYKDPMTGEDQWRLIHVMTPGFILTDSKVSPLQQNGTNGTNGISGINQNQSGTGGFAQTNTSGFGNNTNINGNSNNSNSTFGSSNQPHDVNADPNAPPPPSAAQLYGAHRRPPATPNENMPGGQDENADQNAEPPLPVPGAAPAGDAHAQGANPNAPNNTGPGAPTGDPNNPAAAALNAVNSGLRQQTLTQMPGSNSSSQMGMINNGAGIAGVASKAKGSSIKEMDGQTDYSKWEFVYNPQKDAAASLQGAAGRMSTGNVGSTSGLSNATGGFSSQSSSFGNNSSSFGSSSSGFGSSSSSFGSNSSSFGNSSSGFGNSTPSQSQSQRQSPQ